MTKVIGKCFFNSSSDQDLSGVIDGLYLENAKEIKDIAFFIAPSCKRFNDFSDNQRCEFLEKSYKLAFGQIESECQDYLAYLKDIKFDKDTSAVVDVGWSLNSQKAMETILQGEVQGLYLGTSKASLKHDGINTFLFDQEDDPEWRHVFHAAVELLELPFIAIENQFIRIKGGEFEKRVSCGNEVYRQLIAKEVREEVCLFAQAHSQYKFSECDFFKSKEIIKSIFFHLASNPTWKELLALGSIPHDRHISAIGHSTISDYWDPNLSSTFFYNKNVSYVRKFAEITKANGIMFSMKKSVRFVLGRIGNECR